MNLTAAEAQVCPCNCRLATIKPHPPPSASGGTMRRKGFQAASTVFVPLMCLVALMLLPSTCLTTAASTVVDRPAQTCGSDKLIVYRVTLETFWSPAAFPKHYPKWRPPAQWSKVIGRSHGDDFELFRVGKLASKGLQMFAERGASEVIDIQSQGSGGVYDEFNAPPIPQGEGKSVAEFFVDGAHPKVSIVSRMVPSPDWFIGVDSFDLCPHGQWLDNFTVNVDPLDAGTDKGLTFSSPNWAEEPNVPITVMTSSLPAHPAASFNYPDKKKLPPIAAFTFLRVKEYELSQVFTQDEIEDKELAKVLSSTNSRDTPMPRFFLGSMSLPMKSMLHKSSWCLSLLGLGPYLLDGTQANNPEPVTMRQMVPQQKKIPAMYDFGTGSIPAQKPTPESSPIQDATPKPTPVLSGDSHVKVEPEWERGSLFISSPKPTTRSVAVVKDENIVVTGKPIAEKFAMNNEENEISSAVPGGLKLRKHRKGNRQRHRKPRDCKVSEWSEWSVCSKPCGVGEMARTRQVLKHPRRGGKECPPLTEKKFCGNFRTCYKRRYFNWAR
ncbi:unnamed protein product [Notodromas monacha]|uniref:Spondin domain-containing protein n=1 Tax=Notodromas monacha TaxID=399045 RepID=A0A7R9GEE4_9CRUS|nr:unnamed protein product [Notodromas monacha]CAG0917974.1 unnamed protein product [Notodromas monacha]